MADDRPQPSGLVVEKPSVAVAYGVAGGIEDERLLGDLRQAVSRSRVGVGLRRRVSRQAERLPLGS